MLPMSEVVLDASAILALLNAEKGAGLVQDLLPDAVISAVNLAEVVTRLAALGMPEDEIRDSLALLGLKVVPFDESQAFQAGLIYPQVQPYGLSLGDRACLALARALGATAVTADSAWRDAGAGADVQVIR
jgi:PIN domain nuclease of toxin-antitoxin system